MPCGATDIPCHNDDILPDNVRTVAGATLELGMESMDVEVSLPYVMGIRDLHVSLLHRLHSPL